MFKEEEKWTQYHQQLEFCKGEKSRLRSSRCSKSEEDGVTEPDTSVDSRRHQLALWNAAGKLNRIRKYSSIHCGNAEVIGELKVTVLLKKEARKTCMGCLVMGGEEVEIAGIAILIRKTS